MSWGGGFWATFLYLFYARGEATSIQIKCLGHQACKGGRETEEGSWETNGGIKQVPTQHSGKNKSRVSVTSK